MDGLKSLNIPVEVAQPTTGMAQAVLHELLDHLKNLLEHDRAHVIDLSSLPLSDSDKRELEDQLGKGEISVTLDSLGVSTIHETRYNGIWWIKHYTADDVLVSEMIEIAHVPEIVQSHNDDIRQSIEELKKHIQTETQQEQHYE